LNTFFTFILGVLVGWLIEWVIDFFYWRKRYAEKNINLSKMRASQNLMNEHIEQKSSLAIKPDNLQVIKGIGAVIEGKLNEAGIHTFEQLGNLTASELRQILGSVIERLADEDSLIKQARELARGKKE